MTQGRWRAFRSASGAREPPSRKITSTSSGNVRRRPREGARGRRELRYVKHALRLGAIGFDAVKHLVLCRVEKRPARLDLDVYPYLPEANVAKTRAASYMCLMSEDGR